MAKPDIFCPRKDGGNHKWPVEDIELLMKNSYYGNILIKKAHVQTELTQEHVREILKCKKDPIYFIKTYCRIISLDEGIIPFRMYDYQEEMVEMYSQNRFCLTLTARQMGKCLSSKVNITIRNKKGYIYDIPIGIFYDWQRARIDGTELPNIEEYLEYRFVKKCKKCGDDFGANSNNSQQCNKCKLENGLSGEEGIDFITCPICSKRVTEISNGHARMHGLSSPKEISSKFGLQFTKCENNRNRMKGESNPAFNHGGKFSPFSKNFIKGYDEEWHLEQSNKHSEFMKEFDNNKFNMNHWLNECDDEVLAKELYTEFQTRDLKWFIKRYGDEEGCFRYREKTRKWIDTMNSKSPEELEDINKRKVRKSNIYFSKMEKELFHIIKETVKDLEELCLSYESNAGKKKFFLYDMYSGNKIVEFNGDFWHLNPVIYDLSYIHPYTGLSATQTHEKDLIKNEYAEHNGYEVLVIWEQDYKQNKEKVIQQCIDFLTK